MALWRLGLLVAAASPSAAGTPATRVDQTCLLQKKDSPAIAAPCLLQAKVTIAGAATLGSRAWTTAASEDQIQASTVVVLKTYGEWTPWIEWLAERYSRQLARTDVQFAVLRDVTKLEPGLERVRSRRRAFGNESAPLCEVGWPAAERQLGGKLFESEGHHKNDNSHILTTVYELLWWKQCASDLPKKGPHFVWFVEHDAFFNGDLAHFVQAFAREDADLMARGFRIAGNQWWLYGRFEDFLARGLKTFGVEDEIVKNVHPLPEISEGKCRQDITNNTHGLVFAQDHVVRYSSRFFHMLSHAAELGIAGPGEGFKPTLCASRLGLGTGMACSMFDFAPERTPKGALEDWISPIYCWTQVQPEPERKEVWSEEDLPCEPRWYDKWVHPVKVHEVGLRKSEC